MTEAISSIVPRTPAHLEGEVVSLLSHSTTPVFVDVVLSDGTGTITLHFQGRTQIPGIRAGARLRVAGVPWQMGEAILMLNPTYELCD